MLFVYEYVPPPLPPPPPGRRPPGPPPPSANFPIRPPRLAWRGPSLFYVPPEPGAAAQPVHPYPSSSGASPLSVNTAPIPPPPPPPPMFFPAPPSWVQWTPARMSIMVEVPLPERAAPANLLESNDDLPPLPPSTPVTPVPSPPRDFTSRASPSSSGSSSPIQVRAQLERAHSAPINCTERRSPASGSSGLSDSETQHSDKNRSDSTMTHVTNLSETATTSSKSESPQLSPQPEPESPPKTKRKSVYDSSNACKCSVCSICISAWASRLSIRIRPLPPRSPATPTSPALRRKIRRFFETVTSAPLLMDCGPQSRARPTQHSSAPTPQAASQGQCSTSAAKLPLHFPTLSPASPSPPPPDVGSPNRDTVSPQLEQGQSPQNAQPSWNWELSPQPSGKIQCI